MLEVPGRVGGMSREAGGPAPLYRVSRQRRCTGGTGPLRRYVAGGSTTGSDDAQDVLATSDLNREAPFFQFGLQRWALVPLDFNIVALKCSTYAALLLQRFGQFTHVPFR